MPEWPQVLKHFGAFSEHPVFSAFATVSARTFDLFHTSMGEHEPLFENDLDYLTSRLTYISEITSTAIRLNASWALTHAAMSLTRDRYEQVVRFSYLVRQKDDAEMKKFMAYYHARANKIFRGLKDVGAHEFDNMIDNQPEWIIRAFTPDERALFEAWGTLDLLSMARKRDALPPLGNAFVRHEKLASFYTPIYQQFSSVSHADMYSVALLGLHKNPDGQIVLSPDPYWPATLASFNALFDIIQCYECAVGVYGKPCGTQFDDLLNDWRRALVKFTGSRAEQPSQPTSPPDRAAH